MSWHYLQELGEASWEESCLDGAPSALLRLIPTAGGFCLRGKETASCRAFPIWDDVCTFDGVRWRGAVDVITGGFPCQEISYAGKGGGLGGERSGLWREMARIICEVRPRFVFVENSPALTIRGLGRVLGDLAAMGYDAWWGVLGADDAGAPHIRKRIWICADADGQRESQSQGGESGKRGWIGDMGGQVSDSSDYGWESGEAQGLAGSGWWESEPDVGRVAHGVAARVDKLRALGNGQVPAVAALAWTVISSFGRRQL